MPDHPRSFIPGNPFQNLLGGFIQEAQEPDIILLWGELEVERFQRSLFSAGLIITKTIW
jgi:hypothetical protein